MLSSMLVVLADDDRENDFFLTERALRNEHPTLESVGHLRAARQYLKEKNVTVLLLDRNIPLDGSSNAACSLDQWCDFIEEAKTLCAVLVYTGNGSRLDQDRAEMAGALDYLIKSRCQANPHAFAVRIREAHDYYVDKKPLLDGQRAALELARSTRMALDAMWEEVQRMKSPVNAKEILKAGKALGREQQRRLHQATRVGKEIGAWVFLATMALTAWNFAKDGWQHLQVALAFVKGYLRGRSG